MIPKSAATFEENLTCGFGKRHEEFGKFSSEHLKVSKLVFSWDSFVQSRKCMNYKFTEELSVMTLKNDQKSEK